jgi:hypothetical protein
MQIGNLPSGPAVPNAPALIANAMLWWQLQQPPPICPTCQTYCRCRRTMLKENARVQYRYCDSCDYKTKTIVPLK